MSFIYLIEVAFGWSVCACSISWSYSLAPSIRCIMSNICINALNEARSKQFLVSSRILDSDDSLTNNYNASSLKVKSDKFCIMDTIEINAVVK